MTDLIDGLKQIIVNHNITAFLEDSREFNLFHTNRIVELVIDETTLSFSEKRNRILGVISDLEVLAGETTRVYERRFLEGRLKCANDHLVKISSDMDELDVTLEYWRLVNDLMYAERIINPNPPSDKISRVFYDLVLLYLLAFNGLNGSVTYHVPKPSEDPYGLFDGKDWKDS